MLDQSSYEKLDIAWAVSIITSVPEYFPTHWHKYIELLFIPQSTEHNSTNLIKINQHVYQLTPGDVVVFWPGEVHEITEIQAKDAFALQFSPSLFNELHDFSFYHSLFRNYHVIRHADTPTLAENFMEQANRIVALKEECHPFNDTRSVMCLYEMFIFFAQYIQNQLIREGNKEFTTNTKSFEKMRQACTYISDNCDRELTLENVAESMGFSPCYFSRIFTQSVGYHFLEYLTLQRVAKAQSLLSETQMSITEISYQSGFKSISTFNRVFRQYRGCSPSEYRSYYQI